MISLRNLGVTAASLLLLIGSLLAVDIDSLSNFNADFEADEGYTEGFLVSNPIWNIDGSSQPEVGAFAYTGSLGLNLDGAGAVSIDFNSQEAPNVGWVDLYLKPSFGGPGDLPTQFPLGQAALTGFVRVDTDGEVYVLHGDGLGNGTWLATGYAVALSGNQAQAWLRMTYRLDYSLQRWDLYLDDNLQMIDIGFVDASAPPLSRFSLQGSTEGETHFDQFTAGFINPLFVDNDNDGIEDAYESAEGMDTSLNDREDDNDFDNVSNVVEYLFGLKAGNADSDSDGVNDGAEIATGADPAVGDSYDLSSLPYFEGFESYAPGSLMGLGRWQVSGGSASVQSEWMVNGSQSLKIEAAVELSNRFDGSDGQILWVDAYIIPVAYEGGWPELRADDAVAFLFADDSTFKAFDGNGSGEGDWLDFQYAASSNQWQRVTFNLDYAAQSYSIWVNGVLAASDLGFANKQPYFSRLEVFQESQEASYLDDLSIGFQKPVGLDYDGDGLTDEEEDSNGNGIVDPGETDPLLADTDGDTMPDGWEHTYGLDPLDPSDASANPDGDKLANLDEYRFGANPLDVDSDDDGLQDGYAVPGAVEIEIWDEAGVELSSLYYSNSFPSSPASSQWLDTLEISNDGIQRYGDRTRGFIIPDQTREYVFHLSSRDRAEFWLSADHHAYNRVLVVDAPYSMSSNSWLSSATVTLEAGVSYYFEVLHKARSGKGHYKVAWSEPGGERAIISGANLRSWQPEPEDLDDDGLEDSWEQTLGLNPAADGSVDKEQGSYGDYDHDGIINYQEKALGTSLLLPDSDGDGYTDWVETEYLATSPLEVTDGQPYSASQLWQSYDVDTHLNSVALEEQGPGNKLHLFGSGDDDLRVTSDSMSFFYRTVTGDFSVTVSSDTAERFLTAGTFAIMARESLSPDSRHVSLSNRIKRLNAIRLVSRLTTGAENINEEVHAQIDYNKNWFRLVRRGDTFQAYISTDNATWTLLGEQSLDLPESIYLGFRLSSGHRYEYTSAIIDVTEWNTDLDRDGVWDADEALYGTSPSESDTDGDGYSDYDEIHQFFSDPTVVDLVAETIADAADGSESIAELGDWVVDGAVTYAREGRGSVTYDLTLPEDAIYRIALDGQSRFNETGKNLYNVKVKVDGVYIGRIYLNHPEDAAVSARILSPWLTAGSHTLEFYVDNTYTYRSLQINQITVGYIGGVDADQDNIPDWMTNRLVTLNGFDNASPTAITQSQVSPFCLQGRSRYLDFSQSTDPALELGPLPDFRFYTDIALDAASDTLATVDFENQGLTQTAQIEWVATNVAETPEITLRKGDALLLTAFGATTLPTDLVEIDLGDGSAPVTTTVDTPLEALFGAAGEFTVTATVNGVAYPMTVTVLEAELGESFSPLMENEFAFQPVALSPGAVLDTETYIDLVETTVPPGARTFDLTALSTEPAVLAATTPSGAVLDHLVFESYDLASNDSTRIEVTEYYDDGAALVEVDLVISDLPPDVTVVIRIIVGGVTFDDGSIEKTLTAADFNEVGVATLKFIMPFEAITAVCHRIYLYQGDELLGQR